VQAFAKNLHRVARRVEIEDAIVAWPSARTRENVLCVLDQIGVPAGRVASVRDIVVTNEQVQERGAVGMTGSRGSQRGDLVWRARVDSGRAT